MAEVPRGDGPRLAFWLNAYNDLVSWAFADRSRRGTLLRHRRVFSAATTEIDGESFTPDLIEHGMLRGNARPPYGLRPLLRAGDPRLEMAPAEPDPRIHFALNCAARSCPPIRRYEPDRVDAQLDQASRAYLEAETEVERDAGRLVLPGLMRIYRGDFGGREGALVFAASHLGGEDGQWIAEHGGRAKVRFAKFDTRIAAAAR